MKITSFNGDVKNVSKLSDRPNIENGYTSDVLKGIFDKAGEDIKEYINTVLIEELASVTNGASGADRIGSGTIDTVEGDTVQDKLIAMAYQIKDLANGTLPDGSVTPDKFSPEISEFLTSASIRANIYTTPGNYTFTVKRSGTYKITLTGGGSGGGVYPSNINCSLAGGGGASAVLWLDLEEGDSCGITVGRGGEGLQVSGTAFVSHAKPGESTSFSLNGELVAEAGGAPFGLGNRAAAEGGDLNFSGGCPKAGEFYSGSGGKLEFIIGGDSHMGNGAAFKGDTPGIGGGGYAGDFFGNGIYYAGYKGGDGAAIIEYIK